MRIQEFIPPSCKLHVGQSVDEQCVLNLQKEDFKWFTESTVVWLVLANREITSTSEFNQQAPKFKYLNSFGS